MKLYYMFPRHNTVAVATLVVDTVMYPLLGFREDVLPDNVFYTLQQVLPSPETQKATYNNYIETIYILKLLQLHTEFIEKDVWSMRVSYWYPLHKNE